MNYPSVRLSQRDFLHYFRPILICINRSFVHMFNERIGLEYEL